MIRCWSRIAAVGLADGVEQRFVGGARVPATAHRSRISALLVGIRLSRITWTAPECSRVVVITTAWTNVREPQIVIAIEIVLRASASARVAAFLVARLEIARIEIHACPPHRARGARARRNTSAVFVTDL